jgi:hypothetical protein
VITFGNIIKTDWSVGQALDGQAGEKTCNMRTPCAAY